MKQPEGPATQTVTAGAGTAPEDGEAAPRNQDAGPVDPLAMFPQVLSKMFSVPMSAVSILEPTYQRLRVSVGMDVVETPIEHSFCAQAIKRPDEILYVPDAMLDPRFANYPQVVGDMKLRFYAGMPIRAPSGVAVGALCILDRVPRQMDDALLDQLRNLAEGVNTTLRLEASADILRRQESQSKLTQAMLASVFQTMDAAVTVTRTSGAILLSNGPCESLLGYKPDELLNLSLEDVIAPERREALAAANAAQLADAAPYRIETVLLGREGNRVPAQLTVALVKRRDVLPFRVTTLHRVAKAAPKPVHASVAGCIQFLGLQPVKTAYGAKWESVRHRLLLAAENILRRRLSAEDTYTRTDDDSFTIWFKSGSDEDNAAHIDRIRREVQMMLLSELGEETTSLVAAYTQAAEIDDPTAPPGQIMQELSKRIAERRREAEQQARAVLDQVLSEHPREATPVNGKNGASTKAMFTDLPRPLRGRFSGAMSLVGGANADVDTECLRLSLTSEAVMEDIAEGVSRAQFVRLSMALFIARRGRERFLAQWEAMPPKVGSQIFVMMSDIPADISQARLFEAIRMLRPIARGVGVLLDQIDPLPFQPQCSSLSMVGLCSDPLGSLRDAKLASFILRFRQAKIPVLVQLTKEETAERWYGLGADFTTLA